VYVHTYIKLYKRTGGRDMRDHALGPDRAFQPIWLINENI